jgi:hypothetical protein
VSGADSGGWGGWGAAAGSSHAGYGGNGSNIGHDGAGGGASSIQGGGGIWSYNPLLRDPTLTRGTTSDGSGLIRITWTTSP